MFRNIFWLMVPLKLERYEHTILVDYWNSSTTTRNCALNPKNTLILIFVPKNEIMKFSNQCNYLHWPVLNLSGSVCFNWQVVFNQFFIQQYTAYQVEACIGCKSLGRIQSLNGHHQPVSYNIFNFFYSQCFVLGKQSK